MIPIMPDAHTQYYNLFPSIPENQTQMLYQRCAPAIQCTLSPHKALGSIPSDLLKKKKITLENVPYVPVSRDFL